MKKDAWRTRMRLFDCTYVVSGGGWELIGYVIY
jgi:hypothetical protein